MAPAGPYTAVGLRASAASLRRRAPYLAYRAAGVIAERLPATALVGVEALAGRVMAVGMRGRRAMVARHLRRAHGPGMPDARLRREVRRAFVSYARYWVELFRLPSVAPTELARGLVAEGREHLDAALAEGKGAILTVPHLGGWDYGGAWIGVNGYRMTVVVEPVEPPELFEWFAQVRRALGLTIVPLGPGAGTALLRALRQGEAVALLCDRDIAGGGVEVDFFGERTTLPAGPATLALRTGAPVLPVALYFDGTTGHRALILPPLPIERTGRLRDDVSRLTQQIADHLEDLIRRAPDQWHLFQPNWPSDPGYRR